MRWRPFATCGNFRDIGGYATSDGRNVRWGHVFRAGALAGLTAEDVAVVTGDLGVRTIVDVRSAEEVQRVPAITWARVIALPMGSASPMPGSPPIGPDGLGELYLWQLDRRARRFVEFLEVVADPASLPVVLHCNGGKDRTGVIVALLLGVLGVGEDEIVADYALTEEHVARVPPERYDEIVADVSSRGWHQEIVHARPASMQRFLEGVRAGFGSAEQLARAHGADDALLARVRNNLLE